MLIKSHRIWASIKNIAILFWDPKSVKDRFELAEICYF